MVKEEKERENEREKGVSLSGTIRFLAGGDACPSGDISGGQEQET